MNPALGARTVIVANGGANIASLKFALERLGVASSVSGDHDEIRAASHVILPGVGAAADAMQRLRQSGLDRLLPTLSQPVLGICLGMQLLFEASDEGDTTCLGIVPGRALRFADAPGRPVPHMGWNTLDLERPSALLAGLGAAGPGAAGPGAAGPRAAGPPYGYFVHSYALPVTAATVASTDYGGRFSACVEWRNFFGAQFHPERSAGVGARLLRNFLSLGHGEVGA